MKYNKHIFLPIMLALLSVATSCEQEELSPALPEGDVVEITTTIGGIEQTRVAQPEDNKYVFEDADKIHIVSWYDANPNVYPQLYKFENPENPGTYLWWGDAVSTYSQSNDRWHTSPYLCWQNIDLDGTPNPHHCFLAWWPEDLVESTGDLTSIPVTMTGDIKKDDYMFARWFGQRPIYDNVIDLTFSHLMSRFDLHLYFGNQYTNVTDIVAKTEIVTSGTLNLLEFNCVPVSGTTAWQTFTPVNFWNKYDWSGTTICIPQDVASLKVVLSFKADGQQKELTYTHPRPILIEGKIRTRLVLEVGKDILELADVTVTDWDIAPDIDGGAAEEEI